MTVRPRDKKLVEGYIKRIHVNRQKVRTDEPALTVQTSSGPVFAREVLIHGPSRMVHRPDKPLSSGARLWLETTSEVTVE